MTETELQIYFENRKQIFTDSGMLLTLAKHVNRLCENTEFDLAERLIAVFIFELLCFTLETAQGRQMYLRLLNHAAPFCPDMAEKYWEIFDNQENIINRYNI